MKKKLIKTLEIKKSGFIFIIAVGVIIYKYILASSGTLTQLLPQDDRLVGYYMTKRYQMMLFPVNNSGEIIEKKVEVNNDKLTTITELVDLLKVSRQTIINAINIYNDKSDLPSTLKVVLVNGKTTYLNEKQTTDIINIIKSHHNLVNREIDKTQTSISIMENFYNASQDFIKYLNSEKDKYKMKYEEEVEKNVVLKKENDNLKAIEQERRQIYNEKYNSEKLQKEIIKKIKKYCYDNKLNYCYELVNCYKKYDAIHCFSNHSYSGYINEIKKRRHLKELYEIVDNHIKG